jgi:hypothetical protein
MGRRDTRDSGDPRGGSRYAGGGADDMRLQALRDEQLRKKEQGLPNFQELERIPLNQSTEEDKYLYEDQSQPGTLRRDGSLVQGVGVGYGRRNGGRTPEAQGYGGGNGLAVIPPARRPSAASGVTYAGAAGLGAGPSGVDRPHPQGYGGYPPNHQQDCKRAPWISYQANKSVDYDGYNDPYQQQQPYDNYHTPDPYANQHDAYTLDPYVNQQHQYPPQPIMPIPTPNPHNRNYDSYPSGPTSSENHYADPGPRVSVSDPYGGDDDGLGAIGLAATSPDLSGAHSRDTTGGAFGYSDTSNYPSSGGYSGNGGLHVPTPQHLANQNRTADLLRGPMSPASDVSAQRTEIMGGRDDYSANHGYDGYGGGQDQGDDDEDGHRPPPSYVAVAGNSGYQPPLGSGKSYR